MGYVKYWSAIENLFTGVPVDGPEPSRPKTASPEPSGLPFWARMSRQISRQPVRLVAACLASVLGPAMVAHAGSLSPQAPAHAATDVAASVVPASPLPGDAASWVPVAQDAAGACPGLPASVLLAIGEVETGLGASGAASTAGALGPMQFLPSTWAAYGVDGDGDGVADVTNPADAMHAAARLLCANGGADPARLAAALWNYNHSDDYVRQVLDVARSVPTPA
ncbi:MAG TPA: lytic transglycosylase domain-containing protein [Acidimicrobiales bacterium]|nr:lytic transglycosylase domain-containing protein [Acidimicrobiales bacterium]